MLEVLQNEEQIARSRSRIVARGLSQLEGPLKSRLRRFGLINRPAVGDLVKSWDVLRTIEFLEERLPHSAAILDLGCFASEVIVALHDAGFTNLTGVDFNPRLATMPYGDKIRYVQGDFLATALPDASFDAITSISVIEHGYQPERLLRESSRLLRPSGYFTASFDYWPDKINTGSTRYFDMEWLIFSREDVAALVDEAARHGLEPVGELRYEATERAVKHGAYEYSFGWVVLRKVG